MKKKLPIIMALIILLSTLYITPALATNISVYIDNRFTQLTDINGNPVYPFIQSGTTYVPLRGISEALDCDVVWDGNNKTILIYKEMRSDNSVFRNDSDEIILYVDNKLTELKDANGTTVKPFIKDGTTYVPLRGVSQALGCWVRWNGPTQTVSVYMDTVPQDGVTLSENKPYVEDGVDCYYETDGEIVDIDGTQHSNAMTFWRSSLVANTAFNLNGKFKKMTFTLAHHEETHHEKTISFIVDGKLVATHNIAPEEQSQKLTIDLNYGLQLKITSSNNVGMGNIIFWGE